MNGVIISRERFSVKDSSENLYVNTKTPLFKLFIADKGQRTYSSTNLTGLGDVFTIHHGLGYIPMFLLFADRANNANRKIVTNLDSSYPDTTVLWFCTADDQDINIQVTGGASITGVFGYNYFIFYDQVG